MTSGLGLENVGDVSPSSLSPSDALDTSLHIPKNKSTGNLLSQKQQEDTDAPADRTRHSIDSGTAQDFNTVKRNLRNEHDPMGGASGLRRIRRGPPSRTPSLYIDTEEDFLAPPLYHAHTLPISGSSSRSASRSASTAQFVINTTVSPVIEDLQRFPSESLHSFSFARQSEDFLHSRQAILQKSVELIRDQRGFIANAGFVNAEARVRGDVEMQGMMDLLKRAKVVPQLDIPAANSRGLGLGPLTGPANLDGKNPFEKSFNTTFDAVNEDESSTEDEPLEIVPSATNESAILDSPPTSRPQSPNAPRKLGLRRTYTDTKSLSLQQTLFEALAQPYTSADAPLSQAQNAVSFLPDAPAPQSATTLSQAVHTHSSKWTPPAQAFFRTEADSPWTIQAANDLACLTFGITRAEVRSLSILGLIEPGQRQWLEDKLKQPDLIEESPMLPQAPELRNGSLSMLGGKGGITARLLSKAPSRAAKNQRAQTDDGSGGYNKPAPSKNHPARKSRGVLLCGEILPIQKRDGTLGAASFWVMEKRGGFIWIIEQVIEDVAYLSYDKSWRITGSHGDDEQIWGEPLRQGLKLKYLLPKVSLSALSDCELGGTTYSDTFTAATIGGVNVPTTVTKVKGKDEIRVSSLPHIAGIMVLDPETLKITSSNAVFSQALFGYSQPNGLLIDDLIFNFEAIIDVLTEDEDQALLEGLVIPEHSFRRARALLALREGKEDAANIFLRPAGLPARHRDGSDIMVDVQMRIVRSESMFPAAATEDVIIEENDEGTVTPAQSVAVSSLVYALWITYSRQLHSAGMGVARPEHPLASRPATPPPQPAPPPESIPSPPTNLHLTTSTDSAISRQLTSDLSPIEPLEHPPPTIPFVPHPRKKITDFIILEDMGSGAYGEVKLARYQSSRSSKVVIKYVTKKKILVDTWTRDRRLGTVPLEIHVLDFLRRDGNKHPNIVEMLDFFEDDINYYIEMVPHGLPGMDLFDYIELRMNMTESEIRHIFQQVVSAISHLHTHAHIVHRDIKDENVVLDGENRVKLIDFGSAAYIKNGPFDVFVGTIDYAAPEVLQGKPYGGCEQDVWALGILLYTIVFKENPFYNIDEILDHPLRLPEDGGESIVALECVDLIKGMLDRDVDERLKIEEVKQHPWLTSE